MEVIANRGIEQVRAALIAQIQQVRETLAGEQRLSLKSRKDAVKLSAYMEAAIVAAEVEAAPPPHESAFKAFMTNLLQLPLRSEGEAA
ncbi:MAG: hypothetical protein EOP24_31860 [Hyphomicrobiales bacterium]|nr:MAG: hypothetical protein EOP24_31860 [Hyphomicrobiales bacterium]